MTTFDQENRNSISSYNFFKSLGHQTLDPDPGSGIRIRNKEKCWIRIRILCLGLGHLQSGGR